MNFDGYIAVHNDRKNPAAPLAAYSNQERPMTQSNPFADAFNTWSKSFSQFSGALPASTWTAW
jgi:hypothetical protein